MKRAKKSYFYFHILFVTRSHTHAPTLASTHSYAHTHSPITLTLTPIRIKSFEFNARAKWAVWKAPDELHTHTHTTSKRDKWASQPSERKGTKTEKKRIRNMKGKNCLVQSHMVAVLPAWNCFTVTRQKKKKKLFFLLLFLKKVKERSIQFAAITYFLSRKSVIYFDCLFWIAQIIRDWNSVIFLRSFIIQVNYVDFCSDSTFVYCTLICQNIWYRVKGIEFDEWVMSKGVLHLTS